MLFLIHVNIFCKTAADVVLPAELAICKFSVEDGVVAVYHTFIDPGELVFGILTVGHYTLAFISM